MADAGDSAATPVEPSTPTKSDATNVEIPRSRFQDQSHQSVEEYPYGCWLSIQCDPELALLFRRKRRPSFFNGDILAGVAIEIALWMESKH